MFKNAEKISKAIDNLIKITEGLDEDRKEELLHVIHALSRVHQNVLGDLAASKQENKEIV